MAEGIMSSGASLGAFCCTLLQQYLISLYGWRGAMGLMGAIVSNLIPFALIFIPPHIKANKEPARVDDIQNENSFFMLTIELFSKKEMLLITVSETIIWFALYVPYVHLAERARLLGIDRSTSTWIISVIGLVGIVGKPIISLITSFSRVHPLVAYSLMQVVSGTACITSPSFSSQTGLFAFAVVIGLTLASYPLMKASVFTLLGKEWFGIAFSWLLVTSGIGTLLGPVIGGRLYDVTKSYNTTFHACGGAYLTSALVVIVYILKYVPLRKPVRNYLPEYQVRTTGKVYRIGKGHEEGKPYFGT